MRFLLFFMIVLFLSSCKINSSSENIAKTEVNQKGINLFEVTYTLKSKKAVRTAIISLKEVSVQTETSWKLISHNDVSSYLITSSNSKGVNPNSNTVVVDPFKIKFKKNKTFRLKFKIFFNYIDDSQSVVESIVICDNS